MLKPGFCVVLLGATLGLSGCGYFDSRSAHKAQFTMIGMTSNDLQSCAGTPDKVTKLNATTDLYQYSNKPSATGAFSINPFGMGQTSYNGTGSSCTALFRVDHGQVTEVHYTGDNDKTIGHEGICEPIIRGCIRQPEATMRPVNNGVFGPVSGFHSPAVPAQSQSAVWNGPAADLPALKTPATGAAAASAASSAATSAASPATAVITTRGAAATTTTGQ
ncbi:hypothetical protein [Acetobacter conturbans]|uniref:Lipoprotein n=1 Tax=Acetobacter conturbans TaxID=1737472 RepID=A0ABX0K187_9PROT|nr:hypothetical protein [Acetobacter conturbans]NHN88453.1 hypothetical protein [Acetobacter conturbans]